MQPQIQTSYRKPPSSVLQEDFNCRDQTTVRAAQCIKELQEVLDTPDGYT
jgi:hypothetical protein